MRLFQQSQIIARCDQCKAVFDPARGGYCEGCDRMLCDTHYYGGGLRALLRFLGTKTLCPECRRRRRGAGAGAGGRV